MPRTAVVTFTSKPIEWILHDGGSRDWRLNAERASRCEFLVCTQNRHNADSGAPTAPHGAAFLIGRISEVVESPERRDRWLIKISEYVECNLPNIWGKFGPLRYPVFYTTLEQLSIDLDKLPPFTPMPFFNPPGAASAGGMSDMVVRPLVARPSVVTEELEAWRRLDAILAQLDRVPDLATPVDPLEWDEHGVPR
jgi:hypothetical protein